MAGGQAVIRVVCDHGEETQLIGLAPLGVCEYKITFSPGALHSVIIAVSKPP